MIQDPGPDSRLADYRLVFIGPAFGQTSVGDYSDNLVEAVTPYFADVVQHRTPGPASDSLPTCCGIAGSSHASSRRGPGQGLGSRRARRGWNHPFWSIAGLRDVPVTATVHDPPEGLWAPARTRVVANNRLLTHGIHYPLRSVSNAIEGAAYRDRTLFALTDAGRRAIERTYPRTRRALRAAHGLRPTAIRPAQDRPKAVGFFGHVYRGKGFDQIARIRELLPDDVSIRVAGRGTESLPAAAASRFSAASTVPTSMRSSIRSAQS